MERIYCRFCGAKLKKDRFGLICPEDWTHDNDEDNDEKTGQTIWLNSKRSLQKK